MQLLARDPVRRLGQGRPTVRRTGSIRHAIRWMFAGTDELRHDPMRQALRHSTAERAVVRAAERVERAFASYWRWSGEDEAKEVQAFDTLTKRMNELQKALADEQAARPVLRDRP